MKPFSLSASLNPRTRRSLKSLVSTASTQKIRFSDPMRGKANSGEPLVSRVGHQGRALRLFGKWRRVSRSGIPALNNCQCGYDDGVDTQDLEPLMLEFLSNKFSHSSAIRDFLRRYQMKDERFRSVVSLLLDDLVHDTVKLSDSELAMVLDAMEISIQSLEEMSAF